MFLVKIILPLVIIVGLVLNPLITTSIVVLWNIGIAIYLATAEDASMWSFRTHIGMFSHQLGLTVKTAVQTNRTIVATTQALSIEGRINQHKAGKHFDTGFRSGQIRATQTDLYKAMDAHIAVMDERHRVATIELAKLQEAKA